ncbi:hypothetical protein SARC_01097 [Sphaeroforma arctica JP610]|uniref:Uncharacterized protein n=1 Tax=Sphaeroforma arctica JP610 TaxID=667725 RepID=A0A0L0GES0_9EUKA|nr:hypothetical protein SARC_01097 [Sphaeroforma arctica JP610]KNC86763.1 hypothetical protein SARC_01097 [Sphaeroforma arctica JP610]|eukprot:XP_014160665.1 hypothetical protein SARC_01097 [Sphaeroforma arctica JP610]
MEVHTGHLTTRSLLNLTLPGAHNAGNTLLLNQNRMYQPGSQWDDFKDYIAATRGADSVSKVTEGRFHSANLRWNVNHHEGFKEQLKGGIRYFHLKLCHLGSQSQTQPDVSADAEEGEVREGQMESARRRRVEGSEDRESEEQPDAEKKQTGGTNSWYGTLDTSQIYHCHRGYTGMSLVDMFDILGEFLLSHPKEAVVLGFNDLSGFDASQEENLAKFISQRFYEILVRDWSRMTRTSLHVLYQTDERLGVFYGPQLETYPHGIIPSSGHLQESWDKDIGSSGDLEAYSEWVAEDLGKYASQHSHFYVTQNNPNNNVNATFDAVYDRITGETTYHKSARSEEADDQNANSTLIGFSYVNPNSGLPYASLYEWEYEYMRNLPTFMFRELSQHDHIMVNAISTDFMHAARTVELCLYLMRIHS